MNADILSGSGLCDVSVSEMTAVDGGNPALGVRLGLIVLGYAAEKVADYLLSGPGLMEILQSNGMMD
jgi:hypothetical protein